MPLVDTLLEVSAMLEHAGIEYVIGGSLASAAWGQERSTRDADIALLISRAQADTLIAQIQEPYLIDANNLLAIVDRPTEFASGQILHSVRFDKVDLFLLRDDDYTRSLFANKRFFEVAPGKSLPFYSPEDIVLTKLRWFELGNRVSDRQWNDIVQVLETQEGKLDDKYLDKWSAHFDVRELLNEARAQVQGND